MNPYFYTEVAKERSHLRLRERRALRHVREERRGRDRRRDHPPGLRPERRDGRLRLRGRDQLLQLQARPARRVLPEAEGGAEVAVPGGQVQRPDVRRLLLYDKWHQDTISTTNTNNVQNQQGFWIRRVYFTYDLQFSEKFTTRFRLEANSNGQFAGGNLNPYVKDAYLKWTFNGKQALTLGIQPSLTFDWFEGFWGLRHIEKTPADLYRIDSSRDFGAHRQRPDRRSEEPQLRRPVRQRVGQRLRDRQVQDRAPRGPLRHEPRHRGRGLLQLRRAAERPGPHDRPGLRRLAQQGRSASAASTSTRSASPARRRARPEDRHLVRASASGSSSPKKADVFARFDDVKGKLGGIDTGLPGADGIDYWIMSTKQPFKTYIFGGEWFLHPSIRISPNVEWVKYDNDPDADEVPGSRPGPHLPASPSSGRSRPRPRGLTRN